MVASTISWSSDRHRSPVLAERAVRLLEAGGLARRLADRFVHEIAPLDEQPFPHLGLVRPHAGGRPGEHGREPNVAGRETAGAPARGWIGILCEVMSEPERCIRVHHAAPLRGEVLVPGAKNSVLKLMAACLLADGTFEITNVPGIVDVGIMADLLRAIGVGRHRDPRVRGRHHHQPRRSHAGRAVRAGRADPCLHQRARSAADALWRGHDRDARR